MNIKKISVIKSDGRGEILDCGEVRAVLRKKGSLSADHSHEDAEVLYLLEGRAEITIGGRRGEVAGPSMIEIEENVYHKIIALTDVIFLYKRDFRA